MLNYNNEIVFRKLSGIPRIRIEISKYGDINAWFSLVLLYCTVCTVFLFTVLPVAQHGCPTVNFEPGIGTIRIRTDYKHYEIIVYLIQLCTVIELVSSLVQSRISMLR